MEIMHAEQGHCTLPLTGVNHGATTVVVHAETVLKAQAPLAAILESKMAASTLPVAIMAASTLPVAM